MNSSGGRLRNWYTRTRSITGFVALAYLLTLAGFLLLMVLSQSRSISLPPRLSPYILRLGVVYGPAVAALTMTRFLEGPAGIRAFLRRLLPNRRAILAPAITAVGLLCAFVAAFLCGGSATLVAGTLRSWPLFLIHLLLQIFCVGLGEEPGWRGWLLPRLRERYSPGIATAILAVIWGVWHVFIVLSGVRTAVVFLFGVFGISYLFTALWEFSGRNLFIMVVAHASVNAPLTWMNEQSVLPTVPSEALFETTMAIYGVLGLTFAIVRRRWFFGKSAE